MEALSGRLSSTILKFVGRALAILGVGFVAFEIYQQRQPLLEASAQTSLAVLALCALLYCGALFALSAAWRVLLNHYQAQRFLFSSCHVSYARSQLAKYLPGNVFHYAGRYALSRAMGANDRSVFAATIEELIGVAAVFALCGAVAAGLAGASPALGDYVTWPQLAFILALTLIGGRVFLALSVAGRFRLSKDIGFVASAWGLFLLFLCLSLVTVLILTEQYQSLATTTQIATVVCAFCLSWLLGFLIPGAPGGIGVREAGFILLLAPLGIEAQALAIILQFRLVTIVSDVLFFGSTFVVSSEST